MYTPKIQSARVLKRYEMGRYRAALLDELLVDGPIEYAFIFVVFDGSSGPPIFWVTSEIRASAAEIFEGLKMEGGVPREDSSAPDFFLCLFDEFGHHNLGGSNDYGDLTKFVSEAVGRVQKRFHQSLSEI